MKEEINYFEVIGWIYAIGIYGGTLVFVIIHLILGLIINTNFSLDN